MISILNGHARWALRKAAAILLLSSSLFACREHDLFTNQDTNQSNLRQAIAGKKRVPAEWETHESIWMAWPTYNNKHDWDAEATYAQLLKTLVNKVTVDLCVADAATQQKVQTYLQAKGIPVAQI